MPTATGVHSLYSGTAHSPQISAQQSFTLIPSQFTERRDVETGAMTTEQQAGEGMGFCPDFTPDKVVGVAANGLLVSSQDVAQDYPKLKEMV